MKNTYDITAGSERRARHSHTIAIGPTNVAQLAHDRSARGFDLSYQRFLLETKGSWRMKGTGRHVRELPAATIWVAAPGELQAQG